MVSYSTWFIFELIGLGAAPHLSEPQAFKIVSLQIMIEKTSTFRRIFHKNFHHIQVFDVRYEWQSGSGTFLPLSASAKICRFHIPGYNIQMLHFTPEKHRKG